MKICVVAGARPNFMKVAPLLAELRRFPDQFDVVLVHTGQHYDYQMSDIFFDELEPAAEALFVVEEHHRDAVGGRAVRPVEVAWIGAMLTALIHQGHLGHHLPRFAQEANLSFGYRGGGEIDDDRVGWPRRRECDRVGAQPSFAAAEGRDPVPF